MTKSKESYQQWGARGLATLVSLVAGCTFDLDMDQGDLGLEEDEPAAAVQALSESEPNDTLAGAGVKTIVLGEDNNGSLSPADTVDYWRLEIKARTYINIFLGKIPAGSDYNVALLKAGLPVWAGAQGGDVNEMVIKLDVQPGWYALKVTAISNAQENKQYLLRAAVTAVSRAAEWVTAQMPYCQAVNNKHDPVCGGTCMRTGAAAKPGWDVYRSDCSGLVSWAWDILTPDGGLSTWTLPSAFSPIPVLDLQPGDILLHPKSGQGDTGHTFVFESWVDKDARRARILEEETCRTVAKRRNVSFSGVSGSTMTYQGRSYTARRFVMP